jgi:rod shape-determining protein MreC
MALPRNPSSPLFGEGASSTLRLIVFLVLGMVLMTADRHGHYLVGLRRLAALAVEPLYRLAALPADAARAVRLAVADRQALTRENADLKQALLLAQARLNRLGAVSEQNQRLQSLLEVQRSLGLGVQLAQLIDVDLDPFRHRVVLNVGSDTGVKVGQAVLDATGVMGQVIEVLPHTATVMLITDRRHAIPVTVERTGLRTIVQGTGAVDRLDLPNIPVSADIAVGDKLVTSGLGGTFPGGFPVGEIVNLKADESGMFATAQVKPAASLDRSGEVLLLRELAEPVGPPAEAPAVGPPRAAAAEPAR